LQPISESSWPGLSNAPIFSSQFFLDLEQSSIESYNDIHHKQAQNFLQVSQKTYWRKAIDQGYPTHLFSTLNSSWFWAINDWSLQHEEKQLNFGQWQTSSKLLPSMCPKDPLLESSQPGLSNAPIFSSHLFLDLD
jgi:hypothetical protein